MLNIIIQIKTFYLALFKFKNYKNKLYWLKLFFNYKMCKIFIVLCLCSLGMRRQPPSVRQPPLGPGPGAPQKVARAPRICIKSRRQCSRARPPTQLG